MSDGSGYPIKSRAALMFAKLMQVGICKTCRAMPALPVVCCVNRSEVGAALHASYHTQIRPYLLDILPLQQQGL